MENETKFAETKLEILVIEENTEQLMLVGSLLEFIFNKLDYLPAMFIRNKDNNTPSSINYSGATLLSIFEDNDDKYLDNYKKKIEKLHPWLKQSLGIDTIYHEIRDLYQYLLSIGCLQKTYQKVEIAINDGFHESPLDYDKMQGIEHLSKDPFANCLFTFNEMTSYVLFYSYYCLLISYCIY